jgi:hypothetical protein
MHYSRLSCRSNRNYHSLILKFNKYYAPYEKYKLYNNTLVGLATRYLIIIKFFHLLSTIKNNISQLGTILNNEINVLWEFKKKLAWEVACFKNFNNSKHH